MDSFGPGADGSGISSITSSHVTIENSIIAFCEGPGIHLGAAGASLELHCSNVYGNEYGNYYGEIGDQTGLNGNISENPLFCDYDNWVLTLAEQSPCLPENNDCGVLMGAFGMDCTLTGATEVPASGMRLFPCFPNPLNPHTTISFVLEKPVEVRLGVYDVAGRRIAVLHDGSLEAGFHRMEWQGLDQAGHRVPSGMYLVSLEGSGQRFASKVALIQ